MMKIFDAADRDFSSGGNIIIEPTKCLEYKKKSLNGWYIEVELPIKYKDYIEEDKLCVIQTKSKLNPQAFRINQDLKKTNRKITFTANHVMFDMEKYFLLDVRPTNLNGLNALNYINQRTDNVSPFSFYSDVETMSTAYFIRKNMLEACETIEERWGGVFDADNWNINFLQSVGHDNGETIIYGKNMQDMEIYEDWSAVVTRLYPVGYDGIMLPEKNLESRISYDVPYTRTIDFQTDLEEEERTEENLIQELREKAREYITENQYPKVSYTTRSDINNDMEIGDTIQVKHPLVTITTEVLEYVYNVISKKIKELTFGNYSRDVKTKFNNIKNTIKSITQEVSNQQIVINQQTELINSLNKNGFVYIDDNEILILDKLPKEEAVNVWRWGLGGLGFSSNGYEGPFETAITMDGQINAKFITTGTLSVSRIEGLANTLNDYSRSIADINIEIGKIESSISDIADITTSKESNDGYLTFENINQSEPINIEIRPLGDNISYLYPFDLLYPSDNLFIKLRTLRFTNTKTNEVFNYELPDDLLYYDSEHYDRFVLDYNNEDCYIVKKCGYNSNGEVVLLSEERIETISYPSIELTDGNYTVEVLKYDNTPYICYLMVRLMSQNVYTTQFPTRLEMKSAIKQTSTDITTTVSEIYETKEDANSKYSQITQTTDNISTQVSKKVGNDEIISRINQSAEAVSINANKIDLTANNIFNIISGNELNLTSKNITIKSTNFNVDKNGNLTAKNGSFSGEITSSSIDNGNGDFKVTDSGEVTCKRLHVITQRSSTSNSFYITNTSDGKTIKFTGAQIEFTGSDGSTTLARIGVFSNEEEGYLNVKGPVICNSIQATSSTYTNTMANDLDVDGKVYANSFVNSSKESLKKNIKKCPENILEVVKNSEIYQFNYKTEENTDKKHLGFIIGDLGGKYNTPEQVISQDKNSIDTYDMISMLWKAFQEYVEKTDKKIEELEKRLEEK